MGTVPDLNEQQLERLFSCRNVEEVIACARDFGYGISEDQAKDTLTVIAGFNHAQLSDEALDHAAAGVNWLTRGVNEEIAENAFHIGDGASGGMMAVGNFSLISWNSK